MRRPKDRLIAGIDLHSNNLMIGVINQDGKRVAHRKLDCDFGAVLRFLEPFKSQLQAMAVESTFNWYWLVDGLRAQGYPIDLANPAKIVQYSGLKHAGDLDDAYHLAELQRLKILPKAHVYDPQLRPVRDLLRRRTLLVRQRTALLLSFRSLYTRTTGQPLALGNVKKMEPGRPSNFTSTRPTSSLPACKPGKCARSTRACARLKRRSWEAPARSLCMTSF